jgi:hypothetical protein
LKHNNDLFIFFFTKYFQEYKDIKETRNLD